MTDYKCPRCHGGFPASAGIENECPWCGNEMDGESTHSFALPSHQTVPTNGTGGVDVSESGLIDTDTDTPELLTRQTANPDASAGERIETLAERGEVTNEPDRFEPADEPDEPIGGLFG